MTGGCVGVVSALHPLPHANHARAQTNFDDDSPMHARLGRWAEGSEAFSQSLMLRRRKLFDVDKGFDEERRKVVEAIEYVANLWTRCAITRARKESLVCREVGAGAALTTQHACNQCLPQCGSTKPTFLRQQLRSDCSG